MIDAIFVKTGQKAKSTEDDIIPFISIPKKCFSVVTGSCEDLVQRWLPINAIESLHMNVYKLYSSFS